MTAATATAAARPIAIRQEGVPFDRLVRAEWDKLKDTRAARWLLFLTGLLVVAALAIPVAAAGSVDQTVESYMGFAALGAALIMPVVAILQMTSEWSTRTAMVTFTQEPRRLRVTAAKLVTGLALGVIVFVGARVAVLAAIGLSDLLGRDVQWERGWADAGLLAFILLNVLMASAFGVLLQSSAAAIVIFYVLPTTWTLISIGVLADVGKWLDTSQTFNWVLDADTSGHWGQILVSIAVWIALPLAFGCWRTVRREIK